MATARINPFINVVPMVYCFSEPGVTYHNGWSKIGYTEKQTPKERIKQQTQTAGIVAKLEWADFAMYKDGSGETFTDNDFHKYLTVERGIERKKETEFIDIGGRVDKGKPPELFHVTGAQAQVLFNDFASRRDVSQNDERYDYELRREQQDAVDRAREYYESGGTEYLWNCKPRFGKTLSAYELIQSMGMKNVLIVSNRPSISNSWLEDFNKYIGWRGEYCFVTENSALKGKKHVKSRKEYCSMAHDGDLPGMVAFESLQSLKHSKHFGNGETDRLKWISEINFDLLIVDESQEGVDTFRTDMAFKFIHRKHSLYLSGTPFKALADGQFRSNQIFNWTYVDEQEAKDNWVGEGYNPYEQYPRMAMYTYQVSNMVYEKMQQGADLSVDGSSNFTFDLNEFFATNENGTFIYEKEIKRFLHALATQDKYPFSTPELRSELTHTLWILDRIASARALMKLLKEDSVFKEYEIIPAFGDEWSENNEKFDTVYDAVKHTIATHEKTITLSLGMLTVGVTIPEWSGVMMLCNLQSASSYIQAAFRAQNPCLLTRNGRQYRKDTAYVFDFDPARTLNIVEQFATSLYPETVNGRGTNDKRKQRIKRLLHFFPVLGEDEEGTMVELDATQVLSIPRRLKCIDVVRHGFISNLLFANISHIFGAPRAILQIIEKIQPAHDDQANARNDLSLQGVENVALNGSGEVVVPSDIVIGKAADLFGPKIYENLSSALDDVPNLEGDKSKVVQTAQETKAKFIKALQEKVLAPANENSTIKKSAQNRIERQVLRETERKLDEAISDYSHQEALAKSDYERRLQEAETTADVKAAEDVLQQALDAAVADLNASIRDVKDDLINNKPIEIAAKIEKQQQEEEKASYEDKIRDHLRGFSRTIPRFLMAYGDENTTLANFDKKVERDTFEEDAGISMEEFLLLRDGGDYTDEETGTSKHFDGHLFDEIVFDDSVKEFLRKKDELANYFDDSHTEDIFDYIPVQKTNQVFTPKWVVKMMVDMLENEYPGCFNDPSATFADLHMKSGLYITEIVKRLFRSDGLKAAYPDEGERIRHILREQVYGMAPTRIIYLIATNYILGFDETLKAETKNFVEADAAEAAKNGTLEQLVEEKFGHAR